MFVFFCVLGLSGLLFAVFHLFRTLIFLFFGMFVVVIVFFFPLPLLSFFVFPRLPPSLSLSSSRLLPPTHRPFLLVAVFFLFRFLVAFSCLCVHSHARVAQHKEDE